MLKMIGNEAFMGCANLKSVRLPDGLTEIGLRAFRESGLESIETSQSVRIVHQSAFCKCQNLKVLGTNEHPNGYGKWCGVFHESALESVELPSTLKRLEYSAFEKCRNLKRISLPERIEYIGKECFSESGLGSVRLPSQLKAIENATFNECKELKEIALPNCLENIDRFAFSETGLENVEFPASLRKIAQGAFARCESLKTVKFNEGLEALGTDEYGNDGRMYFGVFEGSSITSVDLPSTLKRMEYNAFKDCRDLTEIKLPESLEYIGHACFAASGLETIRFPNGLRVVGCLAFKDCEQLRNAELNEGLEVLGVKQACGKKEIVGGVFANSGLESVPIPSTLNEIYPLTFAKCVDLRCVKFSEGLEKIGAGAFV